MLLMFMEIVKLLTLAFDYLNTRDQQTNTRNLKKNIKRSMSKYT